MRDFVDVLGKMMAEMGKTRVSDAEDLRRALEAILASVSPYNAPETLWARHNSRVELALRSAAGLESPPAWLVPVLEIWSGRTVATTGDTP